MRSGSTARQRPRAHDGTSRAEQAIFRAMEELLAESPLEALAVADIYERAGLSRASFYHYFASKYDVVGALMEQVFAEAYGGVQPWEAPAGRARARSLGASLRGTMEMWARHGPVVRATVEHMHAQPALAAAWGMTRERFVDAVAEQVRHEHGHDDSAVEIQPETVGSVLVCGMERVFYVIFCGLEPRLPSTDSAVGAIEAMSAAAIYGPRTAATETVTEPAPAVARDRRWGPEGVPVPTDATILRALTELLGETTLDDISVAAILRRAGVSRGTFYFYFASKEDAFTAVLTTVVEEVVRGFVALVEDDETRTPARLVTAVSRWLQLDGEVAGVVRSAIQEWPQRAEVRTLYVDGVERMTAALERAIRADRLRGRAPDGPPADALAAVLMWTLERTFAGALGGEDHLGDLPSVTAFLGALLVATIYGDGADHAGPR